MLNRPSITFDMLDLTELRRAIPLGKVLAAGDDGYELSLRRWNVACEEKATVVVKPTCADEVSTAIKFSVASSLPLTVCGGGHSASGASSSKGMAIDLANMRKVDVDEANMTVSFDGGCLWADVDGALAARGLATVGGVVDHTGVGGLILGGGHGWLTAKHGIAIDNLLSVQMVLADGSIVEASEKQLPDLFWAIRGAGAQFGVVTRFKSRVHKQDDVWSGALVFTPDKLSELVAVANEFHDRDGHCLTLVIGYTPDGKTRAISAMPLYHGPEANGRSFFSTLLAVGAVMEQTQMMSVARANTLLNPLCEHGMRRAMGSGNVTMPIDAAALQQTADTMWSFCDARPNMGTSIIAIVLISPRKMLEVAQESTAYANRGDFYDAVTMFGWTDATLDAEVRQFNRKLCEQIRNTNGYRAGHREGEKGRAAAVGRYINLEADRLSPEDAFGGNLERLRDVKRKFDPKNVFHKWHGLGV